MASGTPSVGFLGSLSAEEQDAFVRRGRRRRYPGGTALFREGEQSEGILVVLRGRVKVSFFTDEGREIVLSVRGPGDLLGELSTIDGEPRSATGTALGPVEALLVGADDFAAILEEHPRVGVLLLKMLSRRLREATRRRIEYGAFDTLGRVASRLVELADQYGEDSPAGVRILLPLTQVELAGWVGASREAVSLALRTLRRQGCVETHRRGITVLDREALRRQAAQHGE